MINTIKDSTIKVMINMAPTGQREDWWEFAAVRMSTWRIDHYGVWSLQKVWVVVEGIDPSPLFKGGPE